MLRYLRYLFLVLIGIALVFLAFANHQPVTLKLMPEQMGQAMGITGSLTMPLFVLVLGALAVGILLGFVLEWIRAGYVRRRQRRDSWRAEQLERELARKESSHGGDEVLSILKESSGK